MKDSKLKKLAVLIDADNSSVNSIQSVLEEVAKYGIASVKRVYGDWSSESLKNWRDVLLPHAITPVQQFAYTKGKDATDMILIIDAMDLLYSGALDGFCIVSSDSDFTPLASRIRESGLTVYGFGRTTTPKAFSQACDKFIYIENILRDSDKHIILKESSVLETGLPKPKSVIEPHTLNLIYKAVKDNANDIGWTKLGIVGSYLTNVKPDFDTRSYEFGKLSDLVKSLDVFEVNIEDKQVYLRKRSLSKFVKFVQNSIKINADANGWAKTSDIVTLLESSDLNIRNYNEALSSIHNKWVEFSEQKNVRMIKITNLMP